MSVVFGWNRENEAGVSGIIGIEGLKGWGFGSLIADENEESVTAFFEDLLDGFVVEGDDCGEGSGEKECGEENQLHSEIILTTIS